MASSKLKTIREIDQLTSDSKQTSSTMNISELISVKNISTSNVKQISKLYSCGECNNFHTISKVEFNRHVKTHKPQQEKNVFQCEHCDKSFKSIVQLNNHRNIHLGSRPFQCDKCDQSFTTNGELLRHNRYKHTFEKPHKCTECEYSTVELSKLKRHMRIHTDERPYLCGFCDYASRDTFKLKRHIRIHTGEKPYECPSCDAKFSQSNTLKLHMKQHSNESKNQIKKRKKNLDKSDFIIDENSLDTSSPDNKKSKLLNDEDSADSGNSADSNENSIKLSTSINIEKPLREDDDLWFSCDTCFMRFLTKELLDEHYVKHSGERIFVCDICGIKFGQKFSLKSHQLTHDNEYRENLKKTLLAASQMSQRSLIKSNAKNSKEEIDQENT